MNVRNDSTSAPAGATTLKGLLERLDGRDGVISRASRLKHLARCLMCDTESNFQRSRAKTVDGSMRTFIFQEDSIQTTEWLAGEVWSEAADLQEQLDALCDAIDELIEAGK